MNIALSNTILYVTGKQGIETTSQEELQSLIAKYPYFAPAQLVYAAKLKNDNSFKLQTQIQKAGLFFNNFRWLQFQIKEVDIKKSISYEQVIPEHINLDIKQQIVNIQTTREILQFDSSFDTKKETPRIVEEPAKPIAETVFNYNEFKIKEDVPTTSFMPSVSIPSVEDVKNIMSGIENRKIEIDNNVSEIATPKINLFEKIEPIVFDKVEEEIVEPLNIDALIGKSRIVETKKENPDEFPTIERYSTESENELAQESSNDIHKQIASLKENWKGSNIHVEMVSDETSVLENVIVNKVEQIKESFIKPIDEETQTLEFESEPYYTIDYFASQGIKFDYTKDPHDKLTTRLLKFTDWLKKMKTAKPEDNIIVEDPELDRAIQNIAATSNQSKEIVTETMAEIFSKQGKTEKAIQLYIKLSFLLPQKSTYFASKIKELKGI